MVLTAGVLVLPLAAVAQPQAPPQTSGATASHDQPAPAVVPLRSFLVFFDRDTAALTPQARQIIKAAADDASRLHATLVEVEGYTDTAGSPDYNMGLSLRRAKAVASALASDGVHASTIAIQGFGQTHLLVPTGPDVREPENRRVEIALH